MLYKIRTRMTLDIDAETEEAALEYFRSTVIDRMTSAVTSKSPDDESPRCISAMITGRGDGLMIKDGSTISDWRSFSD